MTDLTTQHDMVAPIVAEMMCEARDATCYTGHGWSVRYVRGLRFYVACSTTRYRVVYGFVAQGWIICRDAAEFKIELAKVMS